MFVIMIIGICDTFKFGNLSKILVSRKAIFWLVYYNRGAFKNPEKLNHPTKIKNKNTKTETKSH